jgi:hypothetical protein
VPKASATLKERLPLEAPPKIGRLLNHQETRYLVISRWEELDAAEVEAKRLNARLVAAKEQR